MERVYRCTFCNRDFEMLPFYGCCGKCFASSAAIRIVVLDEHPQTWPSASLRQEVRE